MSFPTTKHFGFISEFPGNGTHCPAAVQYFQANLPNGVDANGVTQYKIFDIATHVGFYSYQNDLSLGSEMVMEPGNLAISSANATLNNVSVWSANSILTQGRGDSRYIQTGTLANVATSGSYNDLSNTPASYSLPTASNTTLGGVITGANITNTNGTISVILPAAYSLPTATNTTLGGVKVGANLSISNGVLSATTSGSGFQSGDTINGGTY